MSGYEVPCQGGCGRKVMEWTVGADSRCEECRRLGRGTTPYATLGYVSAPLFVIDASEPQIGDAVICEGPGHNRVGVLAATFTTKSGKRYLVDFEGGPHVEDCGAFARGDIRKWTERSFATIPHFKEE